MKQSSSILFTLESIHGEAETFTTLDEVVNIELTGEHSTLVLGDNDEGELFIAPIIKGYKKPYIYDVTDEIGTEHYVYYEEKKEEEDMTKTVYVAQVNVLQDSTQNSVEVFSTYAKALVFIIEAMTESRNVWGEIEITQFINENNWTDEMDYDVSITEKLLN